MTILSSMLLLLPGALASRSEGATMLQTGHLQAELLETSGRDAQILGMKEQILAFAEAGVPAAAVPFLNTIKSTLTGSILDVIQNETNDATALDTTMRKAFTDASTTFTDAKDAQNTARDTTVPNLRTAHIGCRDGQKTLNKTHNTCVTELGTARSNYATSHNAAISAFETVTTGQADDVDSDSACVTGITWRTQSKGSLSAISSAIETYKGAVDDLTSKRTTFESKLTECGYVDSGDKADHFKVSAADPFSGALKDVHDKISSCNTAQTDYEKGACGLSRALFKANDDYDTAYNSAKDSYERQTTIWQDESTNRFHHCQMVHTLVCYVDALVAKDEKSALQTAVGSCDAVAANYDAANKVDRAYNADCSKYEFAPAAIPTRDGDAIVPASPCFAGWDLGVNHGVIAPNAECSACDPLVGECPACPNDQIVSGFAADNSCSCTCAECASDEVVTGTVADGSCGCWKQSSRSGFVDSNRRPSGGKTFNVQTQEDCAAYCKTKGSQYFTYGSNKVCKCPKAHLTWENAAADSGNIYDDDACDRAKHHGYCSFNYPPE